MEEKKYLKLNDIEAYKISFTLRNHIWDIVMNCSRFAQNTVGEQYATAADSISANLAEGFGRYGKKDKIKFYRYAQGSMYESFNWTEKARVRKLITEDQYNYILGELKKLPRAINSLIKWTNNNLTI